MRLGAGPCVGPGLQRNGRRGRFLFEREDARPRCGPGCGDLLVGLRLRDAELLVDVTGGYPQPDLPDEHVQDVGGLLQVFPFLAVKLYLGDALVLTEVEDAQGPDEVTPEGGGQGLAVSHGQVVPDVVVGLALGVAAAAAVRSEGLAQDSLADLLVAVTGQPLIEVGGAGFFRGDEVDGGAVRDDARRVRTDLDEGLHEGHLVCLARPGRILAQPEREAVDLGEADPVLQVVILEQVHPGHDPEDTRPGAVPAAGLVPVDDELVRREQQPLGVLLGAYLE